MPLNRTPPRSQPQRESSCNTAAAPAHAGQNPSTVAARINLLPIDIGTSISPTLLRRNIEDGTCICSGGPGNRACNLEVKDSEQGVQCDLCGSWFHTFCQDICKGAYNALKKHEILSFICESCKKLPNLANLQPRPQAKDAATQAEPHTEKHMDVLSDLVKKVNSLEIALKDHLSSAGTPQQPVVPQIVLSSPQQMGDGIWILLC